MPAIPYKEFKPKIGKDVWIAPSAYVTGKCELGDESSVFFGAALRGDINRIIVGRGTNIQDNAILHTSIGLGDCVLGEDVTIGHAAIVHGAKIGDRCIIGMHSTILDDAEIGADCIIGANSLVTMNTKIAPGNLAFGNPCKVVRPLSDKERAQLLDSAKSYREKARIYMAGQK